MAPFRTRYSELVISLAISLCVWACMLLGINLVTRYICPPRTPVVATADASLLSSNPGNPQPPDQMYN